MSVIKFNRNFSELFNWDSDEDPTTEQEYQGAVRNWTEVEMDIVDTLLWQPETDYTEENIVKTPSLPLHYVLVCTTGGTSGTTEPSYDNVQIGDSVTDGTVEWTVAKLAVTSDIPVVSDKAKADASNIGVNAETDNSELWGNAIGGGEIAEDDGKLVTGGTVYAVTSGLASDIADNTDDIATNTANISQNTTDIGISDKRITNIEKLLQGNLYDYQTDSTSAYTKTVPSGAMPFAGLEKVGGKTIVMSQLVRNGNFADSSVWTLWGVDSGTIAIAGNVFTYTIDVVAEQRFIGNVLHTVTGHKYYAKIEIKYNNTLPSSNVAVGSGGYNMVSGSVTTLNEWTKIAGIFTRTSGGDDKFTIYPRCNNGQVGDTINMRNIMCIDLTLMFGAGNEPTIEEFEAMFPADYYAYNAGTLLSAGVTEVVSKDGNNATLQNYPIPTAIRNLEGYGWSCPDHYNYIDYEAKKYVQEVGSRAYASGDESDSTVITDGTTTYYPLTTAVETDISAYITDDNLIQVEAGGTLTFPNSNGTDYQIPVPSEETYMIDLQEAINNG